MQKDDDDVQTEKSLINTLKLIKTVEARDQRNRQQHNIGQTCSQYSILRNNQNTPEYNKQTLRKDKTGTSI